MPCTVLILWDGIEYSEASKQGDIYKIRNASMNSAKAGMLYLPDST